MEKALNFALDLKADVIEIIAAFGKRMDHTLGNMLILHNFKGAVPLTMYDDFGKMQLLLPGETILKGKKGKTVSLFALEVVTNIMLSGFKYPLEEQKIGPAFLGVSNEIDSDKASIKFQSGRLLMYEVF